MADLRVGLDALPGLEDARTVGAVPIEGSKPGICAGALLPQHPDPDAPEREEEGA